MQSNTYIQNRHHNVGIAGGFPDLRYNSRFNPVVYSGTITGLRISSVDGTAFMDNCAALVPYADGSHLVEIYDASGMMLRGYLGAAGTGETLGDELLTNGDFATGDGTGWTMHGGADATIDYTGNELTATITTAGSKAFAQYVLGDVRNHLIYYSFTIRDCSNWPGRLYQSTPYNDIRNFTSNGTYTGYNTVWITSVFLAVGAATITYPGAVLTIDDVSLKSVLTPSTSGATIVSAKGGGTANFQYKNASFTYNEASYYCLIKRAR